jgi:hypothetical protein
MAARLLQWIYHSNSWGAIWILPFALAEPSGKSVRDGEAGNRKQVHLIVQNNGGEVKLSQ